MLKSSASITLNLEHWLSFIKTTCLNKILNENKFNHFGSIEIKNKDKINNLKSHVHL